MLTADLIRATRRQGVLYPRYVDPAAPELLHIAARLIGVYRQAGSPPPGWRRQEIDAAAAQLVSERTDPLLFKGLCKLLEDRSEFSQAAAADPLDLRRRLFVAAAQITLRRAPGRSWPVKRHELILQIAQELGVTGEALEDGLYADLDGNLRLTRFQPIEPVELLERYNLALAQAVLLRATEMSVSMHSREVGAVRQVFRDLKFFQLIHTIRENADGSMDIRVDGPLSLFSNSKRYGVAMAQFLPSLLFVERFRLEARILGSQDMGPCLFRLDHKRGLKPHRRASGQYITSEQKWFEERFSKDPGPWQMSRTAHVLRTGRGEVVIPDLSFQHEDGRRRAYLEIIGFWRRGSLTARLQQLEDPALDGLLLAVSRGLAGDKEAARMDHPRIVWFKNVLPTAAVKEKLEEVANGTRS